MHRSLSEAITSRPLLFEPAPPGARATPERIADHRDRIVGLLKRIPRVDAIDVPELVDENHEGRPYYRSGEIREFARSVEADTGCEAIVNKVVAHVHSPQHLGEWARETLGRGIRNVILVGGSSRYIPYPGPSVIDANRVARPIFGERGGLIGNIAIPQRTGESHRLLAKTRSGAAFFTTQILFDAASIVAMIREYEGLCRQAGLPPAAVILSVAPIIDEGDAEFVRWLGADIPEEAERALLEGNEAEGRRSSVRHALSVWQEVRRALASHEVEVPVGVNVEEIVPRHFEPAAEMLEAFAGAIDESSR